MNVHHNPESSLRIRQRVNDVLRGRGTTGDMLSWLRTIAAEQDIDVLAADLFDIAGVLRREDGRWRIYINRQDSPMRQLFTLAHELGHFFLHRDGDRDFVDGEFVMHRSDDERHKKEEREANEFAGSLVMPESRIRARLGERRPSEKEILQLADLFQVSPLAMALRLRSLGYDPAPSVSKA